MRLFLRRSISPAFVMLFIIAGMCGSLMALQKANSQHSRDLPPFPDPSGQGATLLFPGAWEIGKVDAEHTIRRYLVLADANDPLAITVSRASGTLAPKLRLLDGHGAELATQGADLAGKRSALKFPVAERGWYLVEASGEKATMSGDYSLVLSGTTSHIYDLLPVGAPPAASVGTPAASSGQAEQPAKEVVRTGVYPLPAGETRLWIALPGGSTLRLKLDGTGTLSAAAPDGSGAVTASPSIDFSARNDSWVWVVVAKVEGSESALNVSVVNSSGAASSLYPDGLTDFVTVTPTTTPTATNTATPTSTATTTPTPTITPTPTATKVVISSLQVTRPQSEEQVIATDTLWIFFNGFPELKAPGTQHLVSPLIWDRVYMMRFSWCTDTEAMRGKSLPNITVKFMIDGLTVDDSDILWFDRFNSFHKYCRYWATQLSQWPHGQQVVAKMVMALGADAQAGFNDTRRAGDYIYELVMRVRQ